MKRNIVARPLLIALLAIASLYCRADVPRPSYNYQSRLGFYTEPWMGITGKEFNELLPWLFLGLFFVCLTIFLHFSAKGNLKQSKTIK